MAEAQTVTMNEAKELARKLAHMTDCNNHNGAALELAKKFGNAQQVDMICEITNRFEARGNGDILEMELRRYIVNHILNNLPPAYERLIRPSF